MRLFDLGSSRMFLLPYLRLVSPITKLYGLLQADYDIYVYLIVLFPISIDSILQLINFTAS